MIKCLIMRDGADKSYSRMSFNFRPMVGDYLPIHHMKEKITHIIIVTKMISSQLDPIDSGTDLIIYTE